MEGLSSDFHSILQDPSKSDLSIICTDGEVRVHRVIMAGRSPVFDSLLRVNMQEKTSGVVKINDFNIDVVKAMVKYIYTAKIEDGFEDIIALMKIGSKYFIQTLVDDCSKLLVKGISVENVLLLGETAELYSVVALLAGCAQFVSEHLLLLECDWKEEVKSSPLFLARILEHMKTRVAAREVPRPKVSRFQSIAEPEEEAWICEGYYQDAISVRLSHAATLTSIGLFGTKNTNSIKVNVTVRNSKHKTIYMAATKYRSTGTEEPAKVPVYVKMSANSQYTILVLIRSEDAAMFYGQEGQAEVMFGEQFKVSFEYCADSSNQTDVLEGQIPTLGFKISE